MSLPDSSSANVPGGVIVQRPRANVYTVLLAISLVAIVIGCLCMYGELSTYGFDFKATSGR